MGNSLVSEVPQTSQIFHIHWIWHRLPVPRPFLCHGGDSLPHPPVVLLYLVLPRDRKHYSCPYGNPTSLKSLNPLTHDLPALVLALGAPQSFSLRTPREALIVLCGNIANSLTATACAPFTGTQPAPGRAFPSRSTIKSRSSGPFGL